MDDEFNFSAEHFEAAIEVTKEIDRRRRISSRENPVPETELIAQAIADAERRVQTKH